MNNLAAAFAMSQGVDVQIGREEAAIDVSPALNPDVLDTIRLALITKAADATGYLISDSHMAPFQKAARLRAAYWAGELWQIDRARRALGLES